MAALFNLPASEVLGLNARSLRYTRLNSGAAVRAANNKLATKRLLQKAGLATPRLFGIIRTRNDLNNFRWTKLPPSFVLKPNNSSGGGGIIVIFGRNKKGNWVKADKTEIFIPELKNHILDILDGNFTLANVPDVAFFEQRIKNHAELKPYSVRGIPDIRILIYNKIPVMAMLRLPTTESGGRANLHAGGIGVGIDLVHGLTTTAIHHGRIIEALPETRLGLSGLAIPDWPQILLLASRCADAVGLTYAGVDVALDRDDGPLILEINARPGLEIQFANMTPLQSRLQRIMGLKVTTPKKGVAIAQSLFSAEIEQEIEDMSGRTILGIEEKINIFDSHSQSHQILAKIDTGAYRTAVDEQLATRLGLHRVIIDHKKVRGALGQQTRPIVDMSFQLRGRTIKTQAFLIDRTHMKYPAIIGRRDLSGFLVDPTKG